MYPNSCHKNSTHFIGNFVTITISPVIILFCGHLSEFQSFSFKIPFLLLNSSFVAWVSVYLQFLPSGSQLTHCLARASSLPTFHYANRFKNAWRYNILIDVDVFVLTTFVPVTVFRYVNKNMILFHYAYKMNLLFGYLLQLSVPLNFLLNANNWWAQKSFQSLQKSPQFAGN